ncbi:unnamed protein product [Phaedon cochleariae]|uniref:N-acetyltransferase ESCO2 n=1 Tax=Phaedon cochleariae TaxID=80249 RepID=A0A9P0D8U7_PHACE|nr:unnamed protein product [Phaedon cochleariae]
MHAATREKTSTYEHSTKLFQRRRSLFPSETDASETDSDLGHISPLSFDSSLDNDDVNCYYLKQHLDDSVPNSVISKSDTVSDYDILGIVENDEVKACTPGNQKFLATEIISPLYLSPHLNDFGYSRTYINETPSKISPTYKLKTPHDTSSTNSKLPKLARKSLSEFSEIPSNKRKLSPHISPEQSKQIKLDSKSSKVRTTLFPEIDVSLPANRFYSNTENIMDKIMKRKEAASKSFTFHTTSRKAKPRRKMSQINKHVGHKIRKPKQKKSYKNTVVRTGSANTAGNSAITEFILDLKVLKNSKSESAKLIDNKENMKPIEPKPNTKQIVPAIKSKNTHSELETRKRCVSPETEPNHNKKFFKSSRSKGIVTMNKNFKVEVDHGKITLLEKEEKSKPRTEFEMTDFVSDDNDLLNTNLENIISSLEDEPSQTVEVPVNKIVLQAHNSVVASDSSILLHQQPACPASLLLSPISQMCDETSGLALNSPKRAKNLNYILDRMPNATQNIFNHTAETNAKLFPIFNGGSQVVPHKKETRLTGNSIEKKIRKLSANQMLLDAGQKRFGVTQCHECNIIYHMGDPSDEAMHLHYHNAGHILRFQGWKNERVVADFQTSGRIIQIIPGDSKVWWKKSNDLMDLINQELGCYNMEFSLPNCQTFLYIKNKMIIGCTVAIAKSEGHQMLSTDDNEADLCSERKYPIRCGIPRVWVAHNHRRRGIATALMNSVKTNFIFGYALRNSEIALSPPTELGKLFAQKYFGTENFYVYYI